MPDRKVPRPRTDISANLHVGGKIEAKTYTGSDWVDLGGVAVFFDSTADIYRTIRALEDLARRKDKRARDENATRRMPDDVKLTGRISPDPAPPINR